MKKIAFTVGVVVAALILTSCASQSAANQTASAQTTAHHDFKGEVK